MKVSMAMLAAAGMFHPGWKMVNSSRVGFKAPETMVVKNNPCETQRKTHNRKKRGY